MYLTILTKTLQIHIQTIKDELYLHLPEQLQIYNQCSEKHILLLITTLKMYYKKTLNLFVEILEGSHDQPPLWHLHKEGDKANLQIKKQLQINFIPPLYLRVTKISNKQPAQRQQVWTRHGRNKHMTTSHLDLFKVKG